ncbi:MAG: hypothetical protein ACK4F8_09705 [Aquabacterium sp.]
MSWLARLKKTAVGAETDPPKPTKPGFGGFGGTPAGLSQKSGGDAAAANDPAHAQDFDREAFEERAAIMEYDGGVSRAEAEAFSLKAEEQPPSIGACVGVDRQSWPHTEAMNTAEIDAFTARLHLFTRHGLDFTEAERLADGLVIRDRGEDDRRLCLECLHLRGCGTSWTCNQWRRAGLAVSGVPAETIHVLQRCKGFKS